jgi:hypothetical protein
MRRILLMTAAVAAAAIPASVVIVGTSTPAFASYSLTCAKMSGTDTGTVTISKCDVPKADKKTYKSASGAAAALESGGTITWSSSGATTTIAKPTLSSGPGTCKKGDTEVTATGPVTGGTSTVTSSSDTFYAEVCVASNGALSLVKGTDAEL